MGTFRRTPVAEYMTGRLPENGSPSLAEQWIFPNRAVGAAVNANQPLDIVPSFDVEEKARPSAYTATATAYRASRAGEAARQDRNVGAKRLFSSNAKSDGESSEPGKGSPSKKGASAAAKRRSAAVLKAKKEEFKRKRAAGVLRRMIEGGGVPPGSEKMPDGDSPAPSFKEDDSADGEKAAPPAVEETSEKSSAGGKADGAPVPRRRRKGKRKGGAADPAGQSSTEEVTGHWTPGQVCFSLSYSSSSITFSLNSSALRCSVGSLA